MYETFGAREINRGEVTFRLFFPDRARAPEIEELVERCANRASRVQHIVHEHHLAAVDGKRTLAAA